MKLAIITAHAGADSLEQAVNSWLGSQYEPGDLLRNSCLIGHKVPTCIVGGKDGMLQAYQRGLKYSHNYPSDILAYLHDDTIINDPDWVFKVLREFEDPQVGLVGFGGALGHGHPEMYKIPYDYHQLARHDFLSNMEDAENHGKRFTGSCDVAVLDGFALIVRREILERVDGWPLNTPIGYVSYDYWLSCVTRRLGYRIRLTGIRCSHLGGRTFVKLGIGRDGKYWTQYLDSHRYIYDHFKDCLPYRVPR